MRALLFAASALMACNSGPPGPVDPIWGKQACDHCAMLISESRPSAQAIYGDGSRRFFDDVGCLAAWLDRSQETPRAMWVRTPDDRTWTDAQNALFSAGNVTPMDFGYLPAQSGVSFQALRAAVKLKTQTRPGDLP